MKKPDISIIIPAYNEADLIGDTLQRLARFLGHHPGIGSHEVIVVATGVDNTAEVARDHAHLFSEFQVVEHRGRRGKGHDVRLGFMAARGDKQIFFDADLATPLAHLPALLSLLDTHDVAVGVRDLKKVHPSRFRRFVSSYGNIFIRLFGFSKLHDTQCGFKGFRASAAHALFKTQSIEGWGFDVELLYRAKRHGLSIATLPLPDWKNNTSRTLARQSRLLAGLSVLRDLLYLKAYFILKRIVGALEQHTIMLASLAAVITAILCSYQLGASSIWFDEAFTDALIQQPVHLMLYFTALDVHPPLYYILIKGWAAVFGHSEIALRSFSVLCASAAAFVAVLTVAKAFGKRVAVLALPFIMFAPFILRYGQEARMYALASLICITATYLLIRLDQAQREGQSTRRIAVWYGILLALGLYTHYYVALVWLVHVVWWYLHHRKPAEPGSKWWRSIRAGAFGKALGLGAVLFSPWGLVTLVQTVSVQIGFWIGPVSHQTVLTIISLFFSYHAHWQVQAWGSVAIFASLILMAIVLAKLYRQVPPVTRSYLQLFLLYACLPIALIFVVSLPPLRSIMAPHLFGFTILGGYILLGAIVGLGMAYERIRPLALLSGFVTLCVLIWGVATLYRVGNYNFDSSQQPGMKSIITAIPPGESPIMVENFTLFYEADYYSHRTIMYDPISFIKPIGNTALLFGNGRVTTVLPELTPDHPSIWFVHTGQSYVEVPSSWRKGATIDIQDYHAVEYWRS